MAKEDCESVSQVDHNVGCLTSLRDILLTIAGVGLASGLTVVTLEVLCSLNLGPAANTFGCFGTGIGFTAGAVGFAVHHFLGTSYREPRQP